jgi:hypothetical protein
MDKHLNKREMKNTDQHIEDLVYKTLKAFDGAGKARPRPFLFARIQARRANRRESLSRSGILSPALQGITITLVILMVAFNIFTATRIFTGSVSPESVTADETAFVEELYPSTPTLYNINQMTSNP